MESYWDWKVVYEVFFLPNQKSSFNQEDPNSMSQRVHSITIVLLCSSIISLQFTNWSRALSHLVAQYIDYDSKIFSFGRFDPSLLSLVEIEWNCTNNPWTNSNQFNQTCPVLLLLEIREQCCFNSTPDPFNGQRANFILKPPKVIESRTYIKKADLECYWNNTVLLLWRHVQLVNSVYNVFNTLNSPYNHM